MSELTPTKVNELMAFDLLAFKLLDGLVTMEIFGELMI